MKKGAEQSARKARVKSFMAMPTSNHTRQFQCRHAHSRCAILRIALSLH